MRSVSKGSEDPHRYDDMLDLPNHRSGTHRPLSKQQRAAQFLPFSALSGYEDGIEESQRLTIQRNVLSSEQKEEMDLTMQKILAMDHPEVERKFPPGFPVGFVLLLHKIFRVKAD